MPDGWRIGGVHLLDDQAARYGDFDDVAIVGLVERGLAGAAAAQHLLSAGAAQGARLAVGEGSPRRRRRAVPRSARRRVAPHDAVDVHARRRRARVAVDAARRDSARAAVDRRARRRSTTRASSPTRRCRSSRSRSSRSTARRARGRSCATARSPADDAGVSRHRRRRAGRAAWSVSAIETYLDCPFKFFAQHVLRLEEEPDDEEVMDPRRQGQFVHEVFEQFFDAWQDARPSRDHAGQPRRRARRCSTAVVDRALERAAGRPKPALERTRLLGSPAAAGLGEAVLRMEAERPVAVVERLLEHRLEGEFTFADGRRPAHDRAARQGRSHRSARGRHVPADRLQARMAAATAAARCSCRSTACAPSSGSPAHRPDLDARRGGVPRVQGAAARRAAVRVAGRSRRKCSPTRSSGWSTPSTRSTRGEFPPTPDDVYRCETCSFAAVCRKDYVGDV